jgi:hypothetical protein
MATKKITINELRTLVKNIIKEEKNNDPKSWGVGSFGVTKDIDLSEIPFEDLNENQKIKEILLKRITELSNKLNVSYSGSNDPHFERQVLFHILKRKTRNNIKLVTDEIIKDAILDVEEYYDFPDETINESKKSNTKKINISEFRTLVKKIIKEELKKK